MTLNNVIVDGFTAKGGEALVSSMGGERKASITFRNGTYYGSKLIATASSPIDTVFENVSLGAFNIQNDPNDGTWIWVTADTTGNVDASSAIDSAIDAAANQNKNVYIPAGTYKLNTGFGAPSQDDNYSNMKIAGAGVTQTKFVVPNTFNDTSIYFYRISNVHLSGFYSLY